MKGQQKSIFRGKIDELNDSPIPVNLPKMTSDISIATQPMPQYPSTGNTFGSLITITRNVVKDSYNSTVVDGAASGAAAGANPAGLAWFGAHFKEIAIVAGAAAILAGLVKLVKVAEKEVKVRYNRVVKSLQTIQKDFVLSPNGLDPNIVLKGQGSRIADFASRLFTLNLFNKKRNAAMDKMKTNVGLHPFCDRYRDEIAADFKCAVDAFNKIKASSTSGDSEASESMGETYMSFRSAISTGHLNESAINEAFGGTYALPNLGVRGGQFVIGEVDENGKLIKGTEKRVQVNKESVREICSAIIFGFLDKYVDGEKLLKEVGVSSASLSDLDASTVDKLKSLMGKYAKPEKNAYSTQYVRLKKSYDNLLKHYYAIGDGVIKNFEKYTEVKDEKHANLMLAGKEKLQAMWDSQKDVLDSNFSHVLIEIVSSDAYIAYLDFILETVMPVFKSGIAGDADYVLDVMPRKGQYYLIKQTLNDDGGEKFSGNAAMCRVISFDEKSKNIKFKIIAGVPDDAYVIDENGLVYLSGDASLDYEKYKGDSGKGREVELPYGKFLALDPLLADWTPELYSSVYTRNYKEGSEIYMEYLYAYVDSEITTGMAEKEYTNIVFASYSRTNNNFVRIVNIKLNKPITDSELERVATVRSEEKMKNMNFFRSYIDSSTFDRIKRIKKDNETAKDNDDVIRIVNSVRGESYVRTASELYRRVCKNLSGREEVEYIFAELSGDLNSVTLDSGVQRLNDSRINEADEKGEVVKPGDVKASKNLVVKIYCANVDKASGKEVYDNMEESKFDGAVITVEPAASIDDLSRVIGQFDPKFEVVSDNASRIKESIAKNIMRVSKFDKVLPEKYDITEIKNAVRVIENRADAHKDGVYPRFVELFKKLSLSVYDFKKGKISTSKGEPVVGSEDLVYRVGFGSRRVFPGGYVKLHTGEKKGDEDISINFYPVLLPKKDSSGRTSYEQAVIFTIENPDGTVATRFTDLAKSDKLSDELNAMIGAYKDGKSVSDTMYSTLVLPKDAPDVASSIEFKDAVFQLLSKIKVDAPAKKVEIEGGKFNNRVVTAEVSTDNKSVNLAVKMSKIVKITLEYDFKAGNVYVYVTDDRKSAETVKGSDNNALFNAIYKKCSSIAAESVKVEYSYGGKVNEGYSIERDFNNNMPGTWYIVTESSFDNGTASLLERESFRNTMKTKSDIMKFSKKKSNVSVSPFKKNNNVTFESLEDSYGNSVCETLMLVRVDENEKIVNSVYLGKQKMNVLND